MSRIAKKRLTKLEQERAQSSKPKQVPSLIDFCIATHHNYRPGWHHHAICKQIERMISGEVDRLMLFMPPRHGKTEIVSRRLPAYILGLDPNVQIIACSYAADLAARINRDVQRVIDSPEYHRIFPDTSLNASNVRTVAGSYMRNSDLFEIVGHRGSYRSAGIGGGISGMGAHWAIIDDPFKNRAEANSLTVRQSVWEWYTSTFRTRFEDNAKALLIMTRWHEDDLAGRLLQLAKDEAAADQWEVVSYPGICEEERDGDPRQIGDPLWPEKYPIEELMRIKASVGIYDWTALYQQRPAPLEGGMIQGNWFQRYTVPPFEFEQIVLSLDTASKAKELNCPWAATVWGIHQGRYYLLYCLIKRMEYPEGKRTIGNLLHRFNPHAVLIEDKSTGQSLLQEFRQGVPDELGELHWYNLIPILPCGDKVTRMSVESPAIEAGRVWLPEYADWLPDYELSMTTFPSSTISDPVDSTSQFLAWIRGGYNPNLLDALT